LNHEIESYNIGTLWAWVNVTSLSSFVDTKLWMYYGNNSCNSQENVAYTWNNNFSGVWHFNTTPVDGASYPDSTYKGHNGTLKDSDGDSHSDIFIGRCINFTGDADTIDCGSVGFNFSNKATWEFWVKPDDDWTDYTHAGIFHKYQTNSTCFNSPSYLLETIPCFFQSSSIFKLSVNTQPVQSSCTLNFI